MADSPDLDAIRERLAKATPGPWSYGDTAMWSDDPNTPDSGEEFSFGQATVIDCCPECDMTGNVPNEANREFIAHAPTDIASLLAEVDRQASEIGRLRGICEQHDIDPEGCDVCFVETMGGGPGHRLLPGDDPAAEAQQEIERLRNLVDALAFPEDCQ